MAKKLKFGSEDIAVIEYKDSLFFNRNQVATSIGYSGSGSIKPPDQCDLIVYGNHTFISLDDLAESLDKASGETRTQAAGLMQKIQETYNIKPKTIDSNGIDDLPSTAKAWAKAVLNKQAAKTLFCEAEEEERRLFKKLEEERDA